MKVNTTKTAMACISDAMSYQAEAYIKDWEGNIIESGGSMKILGFFFSDRPTMRAHVQALQKNLEDRTGPYTTLKGLVLRKKNYLKLPHYYPPHS